MPRVPANDPSKWNSLSLLCSPVVGRDGGPQWTSESLLPCSRLDISTLFSLQVAMPASSSRCTLCRRKRCVQTVSLWERRRKKRRCMDLCLFATPKTPDAETHATCENAARRACRALEPRGQEGQQIGPKPLHARASVMHIGCVRLC